MPSTVSRPLVPSPRRRRGLTHLTRRYRRPLAAGLFVLALACLIRPVAEARGVTGTALVLTRPLAAGEVVSLDDIARVEVPADALPDDAITDSGQIVGARLTVPASAREVLTPGRLVAAQGSLPYGKVVAPVRIADTQAAALVRVGDLVDVLAASASGTLKSAANQEASTVAAGARVAAAPSSGASSDRRGGLFGSSSSAFDGGGLLLLAVDADTAARLAGAAATSRLSIVLRPEN